MVPKNRGALTLLQLLKRGAPILLSPYQTSEVLGLNEAMENMAKHWHDVQDEVQQKLQQANAKYKKVDDLHSRKLVYTIGDKVMLLMRKESFSTGTYNKLQPKKYLSDTINISKIFNIVDIYLFHLIE